MEIKPDATLVVRAPKRLPLREIRRFIGSHEQWITQKRAEAIARPKPAKKEFIDGEKFLVTGKTYFLSLIDSCPTDVALFGDQLVLSTQTQRQPRDVLTKWYRSHARSIFTERVRHYANIMGCHPSMIRITSPGRRWGSCGPTNSLNFNWRLVMAPVEIIDYVVIHELVHVRHKHHRPDFWELVSVFAPGHRLARRWLKDNGHTLEF